MKLVKSLLLGSAAGLVAVAGAQAADLPVKKAAPVEYVRVCSAYGVGFFFIPGTDTCLRVSGRARFEYEYREQRGRGGGPLGNGAYPDNSGFRGLGRINIDARTQTDYGTLRTFVRYEIAKRTGLTILRSGTQERFGNAIPGVGVDEFGRSQQFVNVDKAFIQFAGLTAGRATSFYDFYANDLNWNTISGSDVSATQLLAYTATFGSGFSATLSIEDPVERRNPLFNTGGFFVGVASGSIPTGIIGGPANGGVFVSPVAIGFNANGVPTTAVNLDVTQRNQVPDIVGNLRVDQAWGSAQLSGAVHQLLVGTPVGAPFAINPAPASSVTAAANAASFTANRPDSDYGFGIQGGVKFNLPMIAPGDVLWLQAAYAEGANSYSGAFGNLGGEATTLSFTNRYNVSTLDGVVNAFGRIKRTESASFTAAFLHYWTPQLRQGVYGSYAQVDFANSLRTGFGPAGVAPFTLNAAGGFTNAVGAATSPLFRDFNVYHVGSNLIYSPVRDLDIGVEVFYQATDIRGRVVDSNKPATINGVPRTTSYDDQFVTRLRIQRDF